MSYAAILQSAPAFTAVDKTQGGSVADRIDDSANRIAALFTAQGFESDKLDPNFLREQISQVQLAPITRPGGGPGLLLFAAGEDKPFTPMQEDADIFGMLNEVVTQLDKLKDFKDLGVYHSSAVTRDFESTNADNFLNTFKGIATEVANLGAAAASGGAAPTVDVSSIVNTITDSLSTAINHSSDTLAKVEDSQLIATRKGPNGPEYIGIKYHYDYKLEEWTSCGTDHKKGHYSVQKTFFVSYSLAQFRTLYAKAFPELKDYHITFYYGDKALEGSGLVLTKDQVDGKIISALGNTVSGEITNVPSDKDSVFVKRKAAIGIRESGINALLANEFKGMTLKKTDDNGNTTYYTIKLQLTAAA